MDPLAEDTAREIGAHLRELERAVSAATAVLQNPAGHRPETFEDLLNRIQDEGYQARRAYSPQEQS